MNDKQHPPPPPARSRSFRWSGKRVGRNARGPSRPFGEVTASSTSAPGKTRIQMERPNTTIRFELVGGRGNNHEKGQMDS